MQTRPVARARREVTVIGLGTRGLGGGLRDVEPADAARAVPAAIDAGCTLVDVSPAWGDALAVTGAALRSARARDRVCVACSVPPAAASGGVGRVMPPGYLQRSVEDSLRALRLDAIPLVWLGGWRDAWLDERPWPELLGTLHRLVREGKVMAWGVSAPDGAPDDALRAAAEPWPAAISVRHSLFDRSALAALVPAAAKAEIAVIAREPLAHGALGGELAPGMRFPPDDERNEIPRARLAAIIPELARLAALVTHTPPAAASTDAGRALLDGLRRADDLEIPTVAELALRAAIDPPGITAAVVGARDPRHAAIALGCADGGSLPARIRAVLDDRAWGEGWY
jgi:aryl-alcohol dehydrogenase-like predicted oxidoreductase